MREFERQKIKESLANFLVVGAVFNRDGLGMRYAANRGYPKKKQQDASTIHSHLQLTSV